MNSFLKRVLTAIFWAILIASASVLGGYAGLFFGLGVMALIGLAFAFRRRLRLFEGWSLRGFILAMILAASLSVLLWIGFWKCILIIV